MWGKGWGIGNGALLEPRSQNRDLGRPVCGRARGLEEVLANLAMLYSVQPETAAMTQVSPVF